VLDASSPTFELATTDPAKALKALTEPEIHHVWLEGPRLAMPRRKTSDVPGVHVVASPLKRWLVGTLHYGIADSHLPTTSTSTCSRSTAGRTSPSRGLLFYRLLPEAVNTNPYPLDTRIQSLTSSQTTALKRISGTLVRSPGA
jgi:hypothetical protein